MPGPHPAVAAVRHAVRAVLLDRPPWSLVLVACSGGADSLALAAATAFEAPRAGLRAGAVVVDHGLQEGSAAAAAAAAAACRGLGMDPVEIVPVTVTAAGNGSEDAARTARYAALDEAAARHTAPLVLLGHTRDDQAEQVLLGLARGSGARSLAGMPPARGVYCRPLLGVSREQTEAACAALGLTPWRDPQNADPAFARTRARGALAVLETALGPGVAAALARSADLLRDDADLLDDLARQALAEVSVPPAGLGPGSGATTGASVATGPSVATGASVAGLAALPAALRRRVWRLLTAEAGAGALTATHVGLLDALVVQWRGQGPVALPGGFVGRRVGGVVQVGRDR